MGTVSERAKTERFKFIARLSCHFGVRYLCQKLNVSTSGYYKWASRPVSARVQRNIELTHKVKAIFEEHKGNYGSPRVHKVLINLGLKVNRKRVAWIMKTEGLVAKAATLYRRKPLAENTCRQAQNLIYKQTPHTLNQHWAGDVSYLRVNGKWFYLSVVLDLYSRKVIGWSLDSHRTTDLTLKSLRMAIRNRKVEPGLIFHSDKGAEYGSHLFQDQLKQVGIKPSMNRPKAMIDNILVETFFRTFKTETFHGEKFENFKHLYSMTKWYLEDYYNSLRMHTSLGFKSPEQYERISI